MTALPAVLPRASLVRLARHLAYGGTTTGLLGLAGYGVLRGEAKLARRVIKPPEAGGPYPDGRYGDSLGRPLRLAVLGDSSGVGLGCATPNETPGALLATALAADDRQVVLDVLAVVGSRSHDLEPQVFRALLQPPHVGVIMIGANDVTHRVSPQQAATDLYRAVVRLRAAGVRVVVGTCPDLAAVRPIPQPLRWVAWVRSRAMAEAQLEAVTAAGGSVVPLGRLLARTFATEPGLFCPDRFHPSAAGYAALMAAMLPAVRAEADQSVHRGTRPNPVRLPPSTVTLDAASVRGVRHA